MTSSDSNQSTTVDLLRHQAGMVHQVLVINLEGITQAESLIQPRPAGNCLNWVVGHLLAVYHQALALLGQEPVIAPSVIQRYNRGSAPMIDAGDALDIAEMMSAWDETCKRVDAGLAGFTDEKLAAPAPMSPTGNPNETMGTLLSTVCWHQAYHAGQTGVLRRIAGKPGAIK